MAFDLISHECLLEKLCVFFSAMRTQETGFDHTNSHHLSETAVITGGVPRGSILGPLLFILNINYLPQHINNNAHTFTDDSPHTRVVTTLTKYSTVFRLT